MKNINTLKRSETCTAEQIHKIHKIEKETEKIRRLIKNNIYRFDQLEIARKRTKKSNLDYLNKLQEN